MSSRTHQAFFRPRARMLEILGSQLIRHHRIALFELVKNAYDADSPAVDVRFLGLGSNQLVIEVQDSGVGMDIETVLHVWLEPASPYQEDRRRDGVRSPRYHRLPVGEKGVGRFAVQKLGSRLHMVTRRAGLPEVVVDLDWNVLTARDYLDEAEITVVERTPEVFTGDGHGTLLRVADCRQDWTRGDVRRLHRAVSAMVSPFRNEDRFEVRLSLDPDPGWLGDSLFTAEKAADFALFSFEFFIDVDGFESAYAYTPMPTLQAAFPGVRPRTTATARDSGFEFLRLAPPDDENAGWRRRRQRLTGPDGPSNPLQGIGPIMGHLLVFDLDRHVKAQLHDVEGLNGFLAEQGGIRVYRDGMRVYDYGEPGNDWLGLDARRVNTPVGKLSNRLVLGEIHLDLAQSPGLREKTNREGFEENNAFRELRYAALCSFAVLEAERDKDKRILREAVKAKEGGGLVSGNGPEAAIHDLRRKVFAAGLSGTIGAYVDRVERTYREARDVLMSAVGAGLGLSLVFHEIERGVRGLMVAVERGAPSERLLSMTRQLVELLEGASMLVKKNDRETLKASDLFRYATFAHKARCEYHRIQLINGFAGLRKADFTVKGSRRMLTAALSNLVDNSIHWIKVSQDATDPHRCVWVGPSLDLGAPAIVVADSGPGLQDAAEDIIRPFFSRKMDGMGLGLYYTDMVMKAHGGRLTFPERDDVEIPAACSGAVVAMIFGEEKG